MHGGDERQPTRAARLLRAPARRPSFINECAKRGILVMLDMHRLAGAKDIPEL